MSCPFDSVMQGAMCAFRMLASDVVMSQIQSVLTPVQMELLLRLQGGTLGVGLALLDSTSTNQLERLRAMLPQDVLCLLFLLINLDVARWEMAEGAPWPMALRALVSRLHAPVSERMQILNPGGCSGRVFNDLFLRSGLALPSLSNGVLATSVFQPLL